MKAIGRLLLLKWLLVFFLPFLCHHKNLWDGRRCYCFCCQALSSPSTSVYTNYPTRSLSSIGKSQLTVLDGGEWNSVQSILRDEWKTTPTKYGYMKVVAGRDDENRRVVAMQCMEDDDNINIVYQDTVAVIPDKISDHDAIATYVTALSCVHCALPKLENVGGGEDSIATGKAVVLGCSELAYFAADGLSSLGIEVYLVNNKGNAKVMDRNIQVIRPALGSDDTGFSSHVGQFDSLVDTLGNERSSVLSMNDPMSNDEEFYDIGLSSGPSVLQLLKTRHNCHKYVSTLTYCQEVVANEGIFGGPGKAEQYSQKVGNLAFLRTSRDCQAVPPSKSLGKTVESLMKFGVIFTDAQRRKMCSKTTDAVRGWSLSDFWETTSWPRDSSGSGTVRYGLPVREDPSEEGEVEFLISESPFRQVQARAVTKDEEFDEIGDFGLKEAKKSASAKNKAIQNNPYVLNVLGVEGLHSEIVETKMDCIMFMSAKFCKTCRTISPLYTRMARLSQENENKKITFVKAEASGESGKALGRHLSVQAVPSFVLFREGRQFGVPLSVSKLPSRKIDRALELLATGASWDGSILDEDESSISSS